MAYKVFLSHNTQDQGLVIALGNLITKFGIEVFIAEWYLTPGESLNNKIFNHIKKADSIVVLLTRNGIRSNWVQQEIGYALSANKTVIPLVEKGTGLSDLASLQGKEYIEYDPYQPEQALIKASTYMNSLKLKKEELENNLLIGGAILALLLLLSKKEK